MAKKKQSSRGSRKAAGRKAPAPKKNAPQFENVHRVKVRVIGIGGGGGAIVGEVASRVPRVDFVAANTDLQALKSTPSRVRTVSFGRALTEGRGSGMDPELGERSARAEKDRIKQLFAGQDLCILVSSLGGGTGSGASPVFAQAAQEAKCLTVGVFTLPFQFEGEKRQLVAARALERMRPLVNASIVIPNERIFGLIDKNTSLKDAFSAVNKRLAESLEGLVETIFLPGVINIDFADLRSLLEGKGKLAYLNSAKAGGPLKTQEAAKQIAANPLLEYGVEGAERMMFTIVSDRTMKMQEVAEISSAISSANPKAKIIFGLSQDPGLKEKIRVTLFANGCKTGKQESSLPQRPPRSRKRKPPVKKEAPKEEEQPAPKKPKKKKQRKAPARARRNALDVKKATDREMEELEKQERALDVPAFLRRQLGNEGSR